MKNLVFIGFLLALAIAAIPQDLAQRYSVEVLKTGLSGTEPKKGSQIKVDYAGRLSDGVEFESSWKTAKPLPFTVGVGKVIKCWDDLALYMKIGDKLRFKCPAAYAFGNRAVGPIPKNSDLFYDFERVN